MIEKINIQENVQHIASTVPVSSLLISLIHSRRHNVTPPARPDTYEVWNGKLVRISNCN
jgi:hypothetical protein